MDQAAVVDPSTQMEVTIRHPSFGEFAFRCEPDQLGNVAADMVTQAQESHATKQRIADIDAQQVDLTKQVAEAEQRIAAATLLADGDRIKIETAKRDALVDAIAALAQSREAASPK